VNPLWPSALPPSIGPLADAGRAVPRQATGPAPALLDWFCDRGEAARPLHLPPATRADAGELQARFLAHLCSLPTR